MIEQQIDQNSKLYQTKRMQQKQSDTTTNNEPTDKRQQSQSQMTDTEKNILSGSQQRYLISRQLSGSINKQNEQLPKNNQRPSKKKASSQSMDEEEHEQQQSYHKNQQKYEQDKKDQEPTNFDQFNEVEQVQNEKEKIIEKNQQIEQNAQKKTQSTVCQLEHREKIAETKIVYDFASYQNEFKHSQMSTSKENKLAIPNKKQKEQQLQKEIKSKKSKKVKQQVGQQISVQNTIADQGRKDLETQIKKQLLKKTQSNLSDPNQPDSGGNKKLLKQKQSINHQEVARNEISEIKQVSQILAPNSVSAGVIIFQAQRERIATTLEHFFKYTAKHQKHTTNQKQLVTNIEDQIQKKRVNKTPLCNALRDYFDDYTSLCKDLYERSYKFSKSEKQMSANPMINMREELKTGINEMVFMRKATGNQFNRLGQFISTNVSKNVVKLFTDYWKAIGVAQSKQKEKKEQFIKKEKQFLKRIQKVIKVYTKGKQGSSQEEDLFIEMIKYINQEKEYRACLIEYGLGLVPLKKALIKAEETLYEQLQVLFNNYKNQFRTLYSIHSKEFAQIQKLEKLIKDKNTFEKLSDITDSDYVRSVLITLEKNSIQELSDKEFQKVLNMFHFEQVVGNSVELLKGTTTKTFELKNKAEQVVDTVSGNLLIFNKETAQMKEKFMIKNVEARIVQEGVVEIDQVLKGLIFDSHRTVRISFRDNDRAEELICFLNQVHENIKEQQLANKNKKQRNSQQ